MNAITAQHHRTLDDAEHDHLTAAIGKRFSELVTAGTPVFTTSADDLDLFGLYLGHLPPEIRQAHNCNACRRFINAYGGLAVVDQMGRVTSALWDAGAVPAVYAGAVAVLNRVVSNARITGVHLSSDSVYGTPVTGEWTHLHVAPPLENIYRRGALTAGQAMAAKREEFRMLSEALERYTQAHLEKAVALLRSEALYRSEKVLGVAEFLLNLHKARGTSANHAVRDAGTWLSVATAPAGFCHVRSSMIGTLLEDIADGLPFDDIKRRFAAKMDVTVYQRPQAAPAAGNIAQAEKLVEQLGIVDSLSRRYARMEDIVTAWRPSPKPERASTGVFGHLAPKGESEDSLLVATGPSMSWLKFARDVLPTAESIAFLAPSSGNYVGLVTAAHADAPPIVQWDFPEKRNPVSLYVYAGGSSASRWSVQPGEWRPVVGIALKPHQWHGDEAFPHHGKGAIFLLEGAHDTSGSNLALFPEILKSELHGIRSTIEAFSKSGRIEPDPQSVAGYVCADGGPWNASVRVRSGGVLTTYRIDRWE